MCYYISIYINRYVLEQLSSLDDQSTNNKCNNKKYF